jgi:hypothetical protein
MHEQESTTDNHLTVPLCQRCARNAKGFGVGSVTKRLLSSHGSEGSWERILPWHWGEFGESVCPLGGARKTRGAYQHNPLRPGPCASTSPSQPATPCSARTS